jgi:hypothetical protein
MPKRSVPQAKTKPERRNALSQVRPATSVGGAAPKGRGSKPGVPDQGTPARNQGGTYTGGV